MKVLCRAKAGYFNLLKKYPVIKKIYHILKTAICYLYLLISYAAIVYYFSYEIRKGDKPIGLFILILQTAGYISGYAILNHWIIKKVISSKILIVIELFLTATIFVLFLSDISFENRRHH